MDHINVQAATIAALEDVSFSKSNCKDIKIPARSELIIDGVLLEIGNLLLVKDNEPVYNGVYVVKKLGPKGFILTKKVKLEDRLSASIFVVKGEVNKHTLWALARKSKNKSALSFDKMEYSLSQPIQKVINADDATLIELSEDTKNLLKAYSKEDLKTILNIQKETTSPEEEMPFIQVEPPIIPKEIEIPPIIPETPVELITQKNYDNDIVKLNTEIALLNERIDVIELKDMKVHDLRIEELFDIIEKLSASISLINSKLDNVRVVF